MGIIQRVRAASFSKAQLPVAQAARQPCVVWHVVTLHAHTVEKGAAQLSFTIFHTRPPPLPATEVGCSASLIWLVLSLNDFQMVPWPASIPCFGLCGTVPVAMHSSK